MKKQLRDLCALSLAITMITACTKSRTATIKDDKVAAQVIAISDLQGSGFSMSLGNTIAPMDNSDKAVVQTQKNKAAVQSLKAPDKLTSSLGKVSVVGNSGESFPIIFRVEMKNDTGFVTIYRVANSKNQLNLFDQQISVQEQNNILVPKIKIKILAAGVLKRDKNDVGEETSNLSLFKTSLDLATHLQLDLDTGVTPVEVSPDSVEDHRELFYADQVDNRLMTVAAVNLLFQTNLGLSASQDQSNLFVRISKSTPLSSVETRVLLYQIVKRSDIQDKNLLAELDSSKEQEDVLYCSADLLKQLSLTNKNDCVLQQINSLSAKFVQPRAKTNNGVSTSEINYIEAPLQAGTGILRITSKQVPGTSTPSQNPINTIKIADIKDKEFFLRRTLEDAAATIAPFGPGESGNMDIVRFVLTPSHLVIQRVLSVNGDKNAKPIDLESVMSFPAKYFITKDKQGFVLNNPQETTLDKADIVSIDWTQNDIRFTNSPLSWMQNGACFDSIGSQTVADMDMRLDQGVLNFSIDGTYNFRSECSSFYQLNDYWYGANSQSAFNIKERISFKSNDHSLDQPGSLNLPFRAQNLLGFGAFTMGTINPDKFGNTGHTGTESAYPVLQDFKNGKKLTYVLGGLPEDPKIRKAFVEATRQVIADWNTSLHKAFASTNLDSNQDYIDLKIDGEDISPGHLGDLDRNYIWNFDKRLDSGTLGLSQAAPNPRSGMSIANNVLMYSGGVLSMIGQEIEIAKIQTEYAKLKNKVVNDYASAHPELGTEVKEAESEGADGADGADGAAPASNATPISSEQPAPTSNAKPNANMGVNMARFDLNAFKNWKRVSHGAYQLYTPMNLNLAMKGINSPLTQKFLNELKATSGQNLIATNKLGINSVDYLQKIFKGAIDQHITSDPLALQALSATEVLNAYGNRLSPDQRKLLSLQVNRLKLMVEFTKSFSHGPNCLLTSAATSSESSDVAKMLNMSVEDIFSEKYKLILSHEIGHSLGLTHNFKGSVDAANWKFSGENVARRHSSVMDYFPNNYMGYFGPGPYDVFALRAAYTGYVELDDSNKTNIIQENGKSVLKLSDKGGQPFKAELRGNNLIHIDDIKKVALGDNSWWTLNQTSAASVAVKKYHYCTDVHVGGDPMCNRWDLGTTPNEVANFYVNEYKNMYPTANAMNDRINMPNSGSYLGRMTYEFFRVRAFLDETFYLLVSGSDMPTIRSYVPAAVLGLKTFTEIYTSPTTDKPVWDGGRYSIVSYKQEQTNDKGDPTGKKIYNALVVEKKAVKDQYLPGATPEQTNLIQTRGNEYDKALSIMMLTQRGVDNPRYDSIGLKISYADFEKVIGLTGEGSLLLTALYQTISETPQTLIMSGNGPMWLPPRYQPETTDILRFYSILASTVYLDADALQDKDNFASLFRVGSTTQAINDGRVVVAKLDDKLNSSSSLKFWSFDNAYHSKGVIEATSRTRLIIENQKELQDLYAKVLTVKTDERKIAVAALVAKLQELNKSNQLLSAAEIKDGGNFEEMIAQEFGLLDGLKEDIGAISKNLAKSKVELDPKDVESMINTNAFVAKSEPLFFVGFKAMQSTLTDDQKKIATTLLPDTTLSGMHGMMVNNLQKMNQILLMVHPELK